MLLDNIKAAMPDIRFTYQDPQGQLAALPLLEPTIRAAMALLSGYLAFGGVADIEIVVDQTPTGRFAAGGDSSFVGRFNGIDLWEPSLAAESRSGIDPDPERADISIYIDPSGSFLSGLWWDPDIAASLAGAVPHDRTDAFSVILHELLHGLGIRGWRDASTAALPADYQSTWDQYLTLADGKAYFSGPATTALLGAPAEVRLGGSQGGYHLGHGPTPADSGQPWIAASVVNGYFTLPGERYLPGRLELAMLEDLGWLIHATDLVDVVNQLDKGAEGRYMIGWDRAEQLSGSPLADRIEGRGGNDVITGGAGNDTLDGGDGADVAVFAGPRSAYTIRQQGDTFEVRQGDSIDTLAAIERLQFDDAALALATDVAASFAFSLYRAAFNRAPDAAGLGFWLAQSDRGASPAGIAQAFLASPEFTQPAGDSAFLHALYANAFARAPDAASLQFWQSALDMGASRADVLAAIAGSAEASAASLPAFANGIAYIPFALP